MVLESQFQDPKASIVNPILKRSRLPRKSFNCGLWICARLRPASNVKRVGTYVTVLWQTWAKWLLTEGFY